MSIRFRHVAQHRQNEFDEKYAGSQPSWVATYLNDYVDTCFCEKVPSSSDGSGGKNCRIMWQNAFEHFSPFNLSAVAVNMVIAELGTLRAFEKGIFTYLVLSLAEMRNRWWPQAVIKWVLCKKMLLRFIINLKWNELTNEFKWWPSRGGGGVDCLLEFSVIIRCAPQLCNFLWSSN